MKWCKRGYVLAAILALASATIQAADVTITVNGKVVAKPCTVSTTNATVDLGDLYSFSLMSAGAASAWHDVALELTNCPVGTSRVTASFSGAADGTAIPIGGGSANVYVNLAPAVNVGQNLVVDLSTQIFCHNDYPETITDYVTLQRGSAYGGVLSNFSGTVKYSGSSYPFPTTSETPRVVYNSRTDKPWPVALYLTPVSSAGGVVIKAGSLIAVLILRQTNNYNSDDFQFVWNIYANNDVVVPTGGCDVSARDVTVTLPDYPGSVPIPLTVYCAKSQNLGYYLSGTTADAGNSIFTNTASFSPAQGVGVQLTRNGTIIPANNTVSLGAVGTSAVSLGLTANYARTGGQVTAGNVQSIIGVTFVYQ